MSYIKAVLGVILFGVMLIQPATAASIDCVPPTSRKYDFEADSPRYFCQKIEKVPTQNVMTVSFEGLSWATEYLKSTAQKTSKSPCSVGYGGNVLTIKASHQDTTICTVNLACRGGLFISCGYRPTVHACFYKDSTSECDFTQ